MITEHHTDSATPPTVRRRTLILAVIASIVFALTAGLVVGQRLAGAGGYTDDSVEAGFARDMSTHHAQAVEMGMLAYAHSADAEIHQLGMDIALTQQAQIGTMQAWLRDWKLLPTGSGERMAWMGHGHASPGGLMPGMAPADEMTRLRAAGGQDFDVLFCQLMLRHHLGGIAMTDVALEHSDDPEVTRLAGAMKAGQQAEITVLRNLLSRNNAQPL